MLTAKVIPNLETHFDFTRIGSLPCRGCFTRLKSVHAGHGPANPGLADHSARPKQAVTRFPPIDIGDLAFRLTAGAE